MHSQPSPAMDRDDSLALTGRTLPTAGAVSFDTAFASLRGSQRTAVLRLDAIMAKIHRAAKKEAAYRELATPEYSGQTLKRIYLGKGPTRGYGWKDIGTAACIDHRSCGGCGAKGCTYARSASLSPAVVEVWRAATGRNDKQSQTEAWECIIRDLAAGKVIAEGVTWQTLFMRMFPGLDLPAVCPWSTSHAPPGWSLSNFTRQLGSRAVNIALKKGHSAAWQMTPDVRMDLSELEFLQAVAFDDHRTDFMVRVWDAQGKVQTVELWALFAMDIATGAVIDFGLRPKIQREDGTTMGLTMRDMQHLIAHILATYGYPLDYKMNLIVENAAAAVSKDTENLVVSRSGGQINVRRTGVHFSNAILTGWGERWGAPRGKAWLESWFHILDIVLGSVKGQMGSDYKVKPGDLEGKEQICRKLNAIVSAHPELAEKLSAPFEWAGDAHKLILEGINLCNSRTDHDMERHQIITEWRYNEHDTHPKPTSLRPGLPADIADQVRWFTGQEPPLQDILINRYGATRRESPMEKVKRLYDPARFARISPEVFSDLYLDVARTTYKGGDVLDVEVKQGREKKKLRYTGHGHQMTLGQEVICRLDTSRPGAGVWITDTDGRHLGQMAFSRDPRMLHTDDVEKLQAALGAKQKAFGEITKEASKRALRIGGRGQLKALEQDLETISTLALEAPAQAAALPESSTLERAVMSTPSRSKRRPVFKTPLRVSPPPVEAAAPPPFSFE